MSVTLLVSNGTGWLKDEVYMNIPESKRNERGCGRERSGPSPTPPLPSPSLGYTSCHAEYLHYTCAHRHCGAKHMQIAEYSLCSSMPPNQRRWVMGTCNCEP